MIIGSVLFVHMAAAFFGVRGLWKQQKMKESALYAALISISAYAAVARPASLPALRIPDCMNLIFGPVEKWIETVMGGPFG